VMFYVRGLMMTIEYRLLFCLQLWNYSMGVDGVLYVDCGLRVSSFAG